MMYVFLLVLLAVLCWLLELGLLLQSLPLQLQHY